MLLYFFVFNIIFGFPPLGIVFFDISFLICLCFSFVFLFKKIPNSLFFYFCVMLLLILSFYVALTTNGQDTSLIVKAIRIPVSIFGIYFFCFYLKGKGYSSYSILMSVFYSIVLHSFLVFFMIFSEDFREVIYYLNGALKYINYTDSVKAGIRTSGLTYSLSQLSLLTSFGVLLGLFLLKDAQSKRSCFFIFLGAASLTFSTLFVGRVGLLLSIVFLLFFFFRNIKSFFLLLTLVFVSVLFLDFTFLSVLSEQLKRASEIIIFFTGGDSQFATNIFGMYHIPNSFDFLWGGYGMGRSDYFYTHSDVGYIRLIYSFGIVFSPFFMFYYIYLFSLSPFIVNKRKILIYLILIITLLYGFKEFVFYTKNIWAFTLLVFFSSLDYDRLYSKKSNGVSKL